METEKASRLKSIERARIQSSRHADVQLALNVLRLQESAARVFE